MGEAKRRKELGGLSVIPPEKAGLYKLRMLNMKIRMVVEYDNDAKVDPGDTAIVEQMLEEEKRYWIHHGLDINYALAVGGTVTFELVK